MAELFTKVRTIVTTDGEADDMDSFIRLMLYTNEMDIAGIILTSSTFHWAGDKQKGIRAYRWTGETWINDVIDRYAEVYDNLKVHAEGYPEPEYLKSIYKVGNIKTVGDMAETTAGSASMKEILLDEDERDLYIQTWGGTNTTARALLDIEQEYKGTSDWEAVYRKVSEKAIIYIILSQDDTYNEYIAKNWPDIRIIHDTGTFWSFAYHWEKDVRSELTGKLRGEWMCENIKFGHGSLLDGYITTGDGTILPGEIDKEQRAGELFFIKNGGTRYGFLSEGDSPSWFYLIDTGLRSMEDPSFGGWGGRFEADENGNFKDSVSDYNPYTDEMDGYYPLSRWFDDIQSDFGARADWCVTSDYSKANHRPSVTVQEGTDLRAFPGQPVTMHAVGTDPDGDKLYYSWWQYHEAGSYSGEMDGKIEIRGDKTGIASFLVPDDAKAGDTIHIIVQVKDRKDEDNYMSHYQRVIVTVEDMETKTLKITVPEDIDQDALPTGFYKGWVNPYEVLLCADVNDGEEHYKTFLWEVDRPELAVFSSGWQEVSDRVMADCATLIPLEAGKVNVKITACDGSEKTADICLTIKMME